MSLPESVRHLLATALPPDALHRPGLVAVSGGADSVALLRCLHESARPGLLTVAHFEHRLRGAEGDADARFVHQLADELRLPCVTGSADVAGTAQTAGANLEDTARRLRYDWLAAAALAANAAWVATGHTADDQAETVLHRLLRGAGVQGLRGIAPCRELTPGIWLVRPLLASTRAQVIAYLEALGQPFRVDSTNRDVRLTRNRIRHELLPLLRTYNPAITDVLGRLAAQAAELHAEQESLASDLLKSAELPRAGTLCVLDRQRLSAAPRHRMRAAFRLLWERQGWPLGDMSFEHWDRLADVACGSLTATDLPGPIHARARGPVMQVGTRK